MELIYQPYFDAMKRILQCCPCIRIKTLKTILVKSYKILDEKYANLIIENMQYHGYVLLTDDGWAITKSFYEVMSSDIYYEKLQHGDKNLLPSGMIDLSEFSWVQTVADCMVVCADMFPLAEDFVTGSAPWYVSFATYPTERKQSRLFQITKIISGMELSNHMLLMNIDRYTEEQRRNVIRRIAIVESENAAYMVPYIGFTAIVMLDEKQAIGYRILQQRSGEEVWQDYE